jgi:hypothetical protein
MAEKASIFLAQMALITKRDPESFTPGSVSTNPRAAIWLRLELENGCDENDLVTTHYSPLPTHHSLLTTHSSLLTTHHSPLTTHCSLPTTHYLLLSACHVIVLPVAYADFFT